MSEANNRASASSEANPMLVRHGRVILKDVVATKANTQALLDLLSPTEESEVLDSLARIEAKLDLLISLLLPPRGGANAP
jgi:hypothetical protein